MPIVSFIWDSTAICKESPFIVKTNFVSRHDNMTQAHDNPGVGNGVCLKCPVVVDVTSSYLP
jgi:hypothetical protein